MTKREQVLSAILTKLQTVSGVLSTNVERSRVVQVDENRMPFISVQPEFENRAEVVMTGLDCILELVVSLYVSADVPDSAADPIIESINEKMLEDRTFGNLCMDTSPRNISFDFDEGNKPIVKVDLQFLVQYRDIITF